MKTFLVILFVLDGQPVMLDGWKPLELPTIEACMARAEVANGYLMATSPMPFLVQCITLELPPSI